MQEITIENLPSLTAQHFIEDAAFQKKMDEAIGEIHIKIDGLATKDDIKELKEFMKNVNIGVGIFKFTWNNASQIGSIFVLLVAVGLFIKYGIVGVIAWFIPKQ